MSESRAIPKSSDVRGCALIHRVTLLLFFMRVEQYVNKHWLSRVQTFPNSIHYHPRPRSIICFLDYCTVLLLPLISYSLFLLSSQHDPIKHMADQVTSLLKTFWGALICLRVRAMVFTIMVHTILWPGPLLARWLPLLSPPPTPLQPCSLGHVSLFATPLPLLLILTWFASLFPSNLSLNFHALVRVSVTILLKL